MNYLPQSSTYIYILCLFDAFCRVPFMKIEGPLIIVQLLETTLLTLVNYAR